MTVEQLRADLLTKGELRLSVKVVPKAARSELAGFLGNGTLKVRVQAPPERGKANDALCVLLARELGVRQRQVSVVSGETSRLKQVRIQAH